ncbi:hypothetical protein M2347_001528 [Chryseobacterium sp. H1D6B]|nr:hypothetical protein [Chryseobacterium sp. H1D6B]
MNSSFINAGQPEICSKFKKPSKTQDMETPNHTSDIIFDQDIYTINWSDIENTEIDYENYLNDIENFFKEDFENDILEEDIL